MSIILGIDPGPTTCGIVRYSSTEERVLWSDGAATLDEALYQVRARRQDLVLIERVESYGIAGADLLRTAEVGGRLYEAAVSSGQRVEWVPRREVCTWLDVTGAGKDRQVREVCVALHGSGKAEAVGTKKSPGPLYGVSAHGWQALGMVLAWLRRDAMQQRRRSDEHRAGERAGVPWVRDSGL